MKATAEVGGDLGKAAQGAVEGAIAARATWDSAGSRRPPLPRRELCREPARSVRRREQVRNATTGVISGVKVIVKEPFRREERKAG